MKRSRAKHTFTIKEQLAPYLTRQQPINLIPLHSALRLLENSQRHNPNDYVELAIGEIKKCIYEVEKDVDSD